MFKFIILSFTLLNHTELVHAKIAPDFEEMLPFEDTRAPDQTQKTVQNQKANQNFDTHNALNLCTSLQENRHKVFYEMPNYGSLKSSYAAKSYNKCLTGDFIDKMLCDFNKKAIEEGRDVRASTFSVDFIDTYAFNLERGEYTYVPTTKHDKELLLGSIQRILPRKSIKNLIANPNNAETFGLGIVCNESDQSCALAGDLSLDKLEPDLRQTLHDTEKRETKLVKFDNKNLGILSHTSDLTALFEINYTPRPYLPEDAPSFSELKDNFSAKTVCVAR